MEVLNSTEETCFVNLTAEETQEYLYTTFAKYFVVVIVPIISTFGVFANGSFLYVVYRNREMRTVTNLYLVSLAIADGCLLVAGSVQYLYCFTHSAGLNFNGVFMFDSSVSCSLPSVIIYLSYFASVFLVDLVTIERYLAICHTMRYHISRKRAILLNFFAWTFALLLAGFEIPYFIVRKICVSWPAEDEYIEYPTAVYGCFHACDWCIEVVLFADLIQYLLSVPAVIFMSWAMVYKLKHSLTRKGSIRSTKSTKTRENLVRMLQINAFVFFICLTPFEVINLNGIAGVGLNGSSFLSPHQHHYIKWIGRITMLINSAINPVIYGIVNPSYRTAFFKDCCCCCPGRKRHAQTEYELVSNRTGGDGAWRGNRKKVRTSQVTSSTAATELQWT